MNKQIQYFFQYPVNHKRLAINHPSRGFTLLEVMITTAIVCVIVLAIYSLQSFVLQQEQVMIANYISADNANRSLEMIVKEIRNARSGDNGAFALETVEDQQISFYCDFDSDGKVERIRYFLDQDSLKKGITKPSAYPITYSSNSETVSSIASGIQNGSLPLFYYYNGSWPEDTVNNPLILTNRISQTRLIGVKLVLNANKTYEKAGHEVFSYAEIRMLKDNL